MPSPMPFPTCFLDFNRDGDLVDPQQLDAIQALLPGLSDLLVISHGWNSDIAEADELYQELQTSIRGLVSGGRLPNRSLGVLAVHWPSKRFAEDELIPGGAAAAVAIDSSLEQQIRGLARLFDGTDEFSSPPQPDTVKVLDRARTLLPELEQSTQSQDEFARLIRSLLPASVNEEEEVLQDNFFSLDGDELLQKLSQPFNDMRVLANAGGAAVVDAGTDALARGGAAGLGNLFSGVKNGARNLLNLFTYYEMKSRAGQIGLSLQQKLKKLQAANPQVRFHLIGHSFGARLVTAALDSDDDGGIVVHSVSLLQAAFSHWGFAQQFDGQRNGLFRRALTSGRLKGPMIVTHSNKDFPVGIAYPLASRLRRQIASGIGDENDPYGGLGRNGALRTPEATQNAGLILLDVSAPYAQTFKAGGVYNLNGDNRIASHGDVRSPVIAHAILTAMGG